MKNFKFLFIILMICLPALAETDPIAKMQKEEGDQFVDLKNQNFKKIPNQWAPYTHNSEIIYTWQVPDEHRPKENIGYSPRPNTKVRTIRRTDTAIMYDVIYSFDAYSRRVTPLEKTKKQNKFLSLLGCSFTYGNGLNDNETINYYLANAQTEYYPYNYGIGGGALNMHLALAQQDDFMKDVSEKTGAFVYVFIEDHVNRVNGKNNSLQHMAITPYFEENKIGRMVNKGSISKTRPFYTNSVKFITKVFGNNILKGRAFPAPTNEDETYFCKLVVETKKTLAEKFPNSPFVFYSHPFSGVSEVLKNCLIDNAIIFKQGLNLNSAEGNWNISPLDSHPNSAANKKVAEDILEFLKSLEKKPN
jgi:hypothetical protein